MICFVVLEAYGFLSSISSFFFFLFFLLVFFALGHDSVFRFCNFLLLLSSSFSFFFLILSTPKEFRSAVTIIRVFLFFLGSETPTLTQLAEQSWIWIVDLQKTCAILIGRCLGGMLLGQPSSKEELSCRRWLNSELFSSGIENEQVAVEYLCELSYLGG